jgi:hypothetical protein
MVLRPLKISKTPYFMNSRLGKKLKVFTSLKNTNKGYGDRWLKCCQFIGKKNSIPPHKNVKGVWIGFYIYNSNVVLEILVQVTNGFLPSYAEMVFN